MGKRIEDSKFGLLIEIFLNDSFFVQDDFFQSDYTSIKELFLLKDVCDYWFTRAYGNFHKFISEHQRVTVRKYLYTACQCMYVFQALETKKSPKRDFMELFLSSKVLFDYNTEKSILNLYHKTQLSKIISLWSVIILDSCDVELIFNLRIGKLL